MQTRRFSLWNNEQIGSGATEALSNLRTSAKTTTNTKTTHLPARTGMSANETKKKNKVKAVKAKRGQICQTAKQQKHQTKGATTKTQKAETKEATKQQTKTTKNNNNKHNIKTMMLINNFQNNNT